MARSKKVAAPKYIIVKPHHIFTNNPNGYYVVPAGNNELFNLARRDEAIGICTWCYSLEEAQITADHMNGLHNH